MTPQNIQQMQAEAVRAEQLDSLCPGKTRQSFDVGEDCWAAIWTGGGCKPSNVPVYEEWHRTQSLEILVADVVQWANLPDDRHKQGCYGGFGAPQNLPPPPAAPQARCGGGLGMSGGLGGIASPGGIGGAMQPSSGPPPEVLRKIEVSVQTAAANGICAGSSLQSTGVGDSCWHEVWAHVGCRASATPPYEEWHNSQSLEVLIADAAQWASLPSEKHRSACYGAADFRPEL